MASRPMQFMRLIPRLSSQRHAYFSSGSASATAPISNAGANSSGSSVQSTRPSLPEALVPTLQDLMRAKVHMGHRTKLWNPAMAPYILGHRNGMHVINLDKTVSCLSSALRAVTMMAENDCTFLWLGPSDPQKAKIVEKQAQKAGAFTIDGARWIGGTLTNPIKSNQAQRFNYRVPDCVFVVDTRRHLPAIKEAKLCGIPTIGIVDSDGDPSNLTYPIPGNDDAAYAIYLYCSFMRHAMLEGRNRGRKLNRPSWTPPKAPEPRGRAKRSSRQRRE